MFSLIMRGKWGDCVVSREQFFGHKKMLDFCVFFATKKSHFF
jgi:hypothetical protein